MKPRLKKKEDRDTEKRITGKHTFKKDEYVIHTAKYPPLRYF